MTHIGTIGITTITFTAMVTDGTFTDSTGGIDGIDPMSISVTLLGVDGMVEWITAGTVGTDGIAGMVDGPATLRTITVGITGDMVGIIGDTQVTTMDGDTTAGITTTIGDGEGIEDSYVTEHVLVGIITEEQ
jgi:hypothetical protein